MLHPVHLEIVDGEYYCTEHPSDGMGPIDNPDIHKEHEPYFDIDDSENTPESQHDSHGHHRLAGSSEEAAHDVGKGKGE